MSSTLPTKIAPGDYTPFGSIVGTAHPEPVRVESPRLSKKQVLKHLRWTEADFQTANGLFPSGDPRAFPTALKVTLMFGAGWDLRWRQDAVDEWVSRVKAEIVTLTALVAHAK